MFLLIGADSEIGAATARHLSRSGQAAIGTTRRRGAGASEHLFLDLDGPLDGWEPPVGVRAACIFIAVARLAACEADPVGSARINVDQSLALVDRLVERGVYTLYLSTNQVFDGETPWVPADAPHSPVSEYGRQKARTERGLRQRMAGGARIGILRLAKVVSPGMALLENWRGDLLQGRPIRAFEDMSMAPVPVDLVAAAIVALLADARPLIAQLTGRRDVTYAEIGRHLAQRIGVDPALVRAVSALASGMPKGSTPRHTTLDSSLLRDRFNLQSPDAWTVLDASLAR